MTRTTTSHERSMNGGYEYSAPSDSVVLGNEATPSTPNRRTGRVAAAGAGALLALTLLTACGEADAKPSPTTSASETPSTTETAAPVETEDNYEQLVSSIEIPAGLSAQELGEAFMDRYTEWANAGSSTPEEQDALWEGWYAYTESVSQYCDEVAAENKDAFAEALYTPGWESNPALVQYVDGLEDVNSVTLEMYIATAKSTGASNFRFEADAVSEIVNSDGSRTLTIEYTGHRVNYSTNNDPEHGVYTVNFQTVDNTEKIAEITVVSRQ